MNSHSEKDGNVVPFENALDQTGFGLYSYLVICVSGLISVSYIFVVYATTFTVPTGACELETTSAQQGLALALPAIGGIIGTSLWGYLADTRGRRSMLLLALLLSATTNALASLSINWIMLAAIQFITVLLATGKYTLAMTLVSECVPRAKRNVVVLLVNSMFLIAQGIMALIAIPVSSWSFSFYIPALGIYWNSWRTLLVIFSVPSLLSAVGLFFLQESPKFTFALGDEERTLDILKKMHKVNMGKKAEDFEVTGLIKQANDQSSETGDEPKGQFLMLFKRPLLKNTLLLMPLLMSMQLIVAVLVWLPVIADQFATLVATGEGSDLTLCQILDASFGAPEDPDAVPCSLNSTGLLIVFGACAMHAVVNTFLSQIVDKVGNRYTAIGVGAVTGLAGILVNLVPNAIGTVFLLAVFTVGIVVMGIYSAIGVALFPTHLRAMAMSFLMSMGYLASFGLVQLLNFLITFNCQLAFYLYTSLFFASSLILILLPDDRPGKNNEKEIDSS